MPLRAPTKLRRTRSLMSEGLKVSIEIPRETGHLSPQRERETERVRCGLLGIVTERPSNPREAREALHRSKLARKRYKKSGRTQRVPNKEKKETPLSRRPLEAYQDRE